MSNSKVFRPGDVVDDSQPFVCQIADKERDKRCHYCLKECKNLKTCGQCDQVQYCSKVCLTSDWKDVHKHNECKLLLTATEDVFDCEYKRLFVRLVCKVTFDPQSRQRLYPLWNGKHVKFDDLIVYRNDKSIDSKAKNLCKQLMAHLDRQFRVKLELNQLMHLFAISSANTHCILDPITQIGVGLGISVFYSFLKHGNYHAHLSSLIVVLLDCMPSCVAVHMGRNMQIRAMRTINTAEEEPTHTFIKEWDLNRDSRRQLLSKRFSIECQCRRCVDHLDRDFDFERYQYLKNNWGVIDPDYWYELVAMYRQLIGQHSHHITLLLVNKFRTHFDQLCTSSSTGSVSQLKECKDCAKELISELLITHGHQHPLYSVIMLEVSPVLPDVKVFRPGDLVVDNCQPFVCQIDDEERDKRCHYCLKECTNLKQCSRCHRVKYCSRECQKADWEDIHRHNECKLLKETPETGDDYWRLFVRLVCKLKFDPKSSSKKYPQWDGSCKTFEDFDCRYYVPTNMTSQVICIGLMSQMERHFGVKLALDRMLYLLRIYDTNRITILDHLTLKEIAVAIYVGKLSLKHDCNPSCSVIYCGRNYQVRAMRTINTAEEVPTVCFIREWDINRESRRQILSKHLRPNCQCRRCVEHTDRDFDFNRYQQLKNSKRVKDPNYFDELIELKRQLIGQHFPDITLDLIDKLRLVCDFEAKNPSPTGLRECRDLAKEVEKEFLITHGRQHLLYLYLMLTFHRLYDRSK